MEIARNLLEELVDEAGDDDVEPLTPRQLLMILHAAVPAVPHEGELVLWQVPGATESDADRIADLRDSVFDLAHDLMEAIARDVAPDIRHLPTTIHRIGETSTDPATRRAAAAPGLTVTATGSRTRWTAGDVLAIPVSSGYRFAVVLPRTALGWAVGVLHGTHRTPQITSLTDARADRWYYTENSEYLAGRWIRIGRNKNLIDLFPPVLEVFHYQPVVMPPEMAHAEFGFAESPDGKFRPLERDEAEQAGLLDGTYQDSRMSPEIPALIDPAS